MFSFFVKTLSRVVWTVPASLLYNIWYRSSFFSMPLQITIVLSKFKPVSNILSFALPMLQNTSKSAFNEKVFPSVASSLELLHLFRHNHFCPWVRLDCVPPAAYVVLNGGNVNIPQLVFYSIIPLMFISNFTSGITTFHFFAELSSLLASSIHRLCIFIKCHVSLSLRHKEATRLHTFTSVGELNNRGTGTHWQTPKERT